MTDFSTLDLNKIYTYANYLTWQFAESIELIKGKIVKMSPAPSLGHQEIVGNIHGLIWNYLRKQKCQVFIAPFDVRLPINGERKDKEIYTVVQPDICIICDPNKLDTRGCLGAPDLIIEVLSPHNAARDVREKYEIYQEAGVKEYWIVYPVESLINVFLLNSKGVFELDKIYTNQDKLSSSILPDYELDLSEVFENKRF